MGNGFTKLFSDIVDSSIWDEDSDTCKVWVTLLALSDENGFVRGASGWLAAKAKVNIDVCQRALTLFESPDPKSRTVANEGRRIKTVERGWLILNYVYFRNEHCRLSADPRRVYQREWMRKKRLSTQSQRMSTNINPASASVSVPVREGGTGEGMVERLTKFKVAVFGIYNRDVGESLTYFEESGAVELLRRPHIFKEIEDLVQFKARDGKFFPQSVKSLIDKWVETLDRARGKPKSPYAARGLI